LLVTLLAIAAMSLECVAQQTHAMQTLQPDDLFRMQQISATAWSLDERYVAIEISRAGHSLDRSVPSREIRLLDVRTHALRLLSSNSASYLGFFNAVWSLDGQRLAVLSVDADAVVRPWI
jgi:hypothetical protein